MISEELIRQRSYEIWLRENRPDGMAVQNWLPGLPMACMNDSATTYRLV